MSILRSTSNEIARAQWPCEDTRIANLHDMLTAVGSREDTVCEEERKFVGNIETAGEIILHHLAHLAAVQPRAFRDERIGYRAQPLILLKGIAAARGEMIERWPVVYCCDVSGIENFGETVHQTAAHGDDAGEWILEFEGFGHT